MISVFGFVIGATFLLWVLFVITMKVVGDADEWDELSLPQKIWVGFFAAVDVLHNFTAGSILFWEFADWERKTLTERMKHILHSGQYSENEWRFKLAVFICKYLAEPWDFGHCRLQLLEN